MNAFAQGRITARPDAVTLPVIWRMWGEHSEGVGTRLARLGDINGDSLADFAVASAQGPTWRVFYGGRPVPKVTPAYTLPQDSSWVPPLVGRFYGRDRKGLLILEKHSLSEYGDFHVYPINDGRPDSSSSSSWRNYVGRKAYPDTGWHVTTCRAADLDGDGDDELLLYVAYIQMFDRLQPRVEIRIHKGGPEFTLSRPSTVLVDDHEPAGGYGRTLEVVDVDRDGHLDVAFTVFRRAMGWYLDLFWGGNWSDGERRPDREIAIDWNRFVVVDANGDGFKDIVAGKINVFLSGGGKSLRQRRYRLADADVVLAGSDRYQDDADLHVGGYLNDRRFEGIMMRTRGANHDDYLQFVSGGPYGPDSTFEGAVHVGFHGSRYGMPIGDCNGDGWEDYLGGGSVGGGVAYIIAGGPHIPRDEAMGSVRVTDERADAFSVWPQPATTVVNIAWRGDLRAWPRLIVVHDGTGRCVARGSVADGAPAAQWDCADVPAGVYLLSLLDVSGRVIATSSIIKE